jgi:Uma2 family endonuclease
MNIHAKMPSTPEEFLVWNEGREGKREFVNGKVVELSMINTTRYHAKLCANVIIELSKALNLDVFDIGSADFAVRTGEGVRFPDVYVDAITPDAQANDLAARCPLLLVEVLSPSSYTRDFGEKVEDYKGLRTLKHYLILAQDEARAWLWTRTADAWQGPEMISGVGGVLNLAGLNASLRLAGLYRGIA